MKDRIKYLRKYKGLSQSQLAQAIGKTSGFISNIETGRSGMSEETVRKIALVLGINEEWILSGTGEMLSSPSEPADKAGIGERVKLVRKNVKLTQAEFGDQIGFHKNQVYLVETGKSIPSSEFLHRVEKSFTINYEWLLTGTGEMQGQKDLLDEELIAWLRTHPEIVQRLRKESGLK